MNIAIILRPLGCALLAYGLTAFFNLAILTPMYIMVCVGYWITSEQSRKSISICYAVMLGVVIFASHFTSKEAVTVYGLAIIGASVLSMALYYFVARGRKNKSKVIFVYKLLTFDILINILAIIEFGTEYNLIYTVYPIATHFVHLMILSEILKGEQCHDSKRASNNLPFDRHVHSDKDDLSDHKMGY